MRQEVADDLADHRGAAEPAADADLVADLARVVADDDDADVVRFGHRAVVRGAGDADLELARQVEELRVVGRPLAEELGRRARVLDLVGAGAGEVVGGDVADAVAAGLDRVHLDVGEGVHHVRHVAELRPVELDVGPGGEVAVALVPAVGDHRRAGAASRRSGSRRGWRSGTCRRGAGGRGRCAAAAAGTRPRSASRRCGARPGRGTRRRAHERRPGRNRCNRTCLYSAWRPCWG